MSSGNVSCSEMRQEYPQVRVDENSLNGGWYVWHIEGFGIQESDFLAAEAVRAGEEVTIIYER